MKTYITFLGIIAAGMLYLPGHAAAYNTTNQSATALTDNIGLFTIEFQLGTQKYDTYVPIFAKRDLPHDSNAGLLGYEFLTNSEEPTTVGESAAIVLSSAPIKDGMYYLPAGSGAVLTLITFLNVPEEVPEQDVALHVTELPFYFGDDQQPQRLNVSELKRYITPEVDLNEESDVVSGNVMTLTSTQ